MGIEVALIGLAVAAYGAYEGHEGRKEAKANYQRQAQESRKARAEEKALNFQQQAEERRKLVREERVRRARILQAAEGTGGAGSSGEYGAIAGMNTQLQSNLGINLGRAEAGNRISGYLQNAADFGTAAQNSIFEVQNADAIFGIGMNIFNASGGASNFNKKG